MYLAATTSPGQRRERCLMLNHNEHNRCWVVSSFFGNCANCRIANADKSTGPAARSGGCRDGVDRTATVRQI
jgi:hypothetical protein